MDYILSLCWILAPLLSSVRGLQYFVERPQDQNVIKGATATLRCSIGDRVGMVQWAKDGTMLGSGPNVPGFNGRYSIVSNSGQMFNLEIQNVNIDDDAIFECQVGPASNERPLKASAHLRVLVPPNVPEIVGHSNGSVVEVPFNQPVLQLTCSATNGRPAAQLEWMRNGVKVTDGVDYKTEAAGGKLENAFSTITIRPRYPDDNQAVYTCRAKSEALPGPLQVQVNISVLFPPNKPVITGYKPNQAIRTNDTIHMVCTSEGGNPLAQIVWYRNDVQVDYSYVQKKTKTTNEIAFTAQRADNDAVYRCEAWNIVNSDQRLNATRTLLVYFAAKLATISGTREAKAGETLTLTCTTSNSNPPAAITWIPQGSVAERSRTEPSPDGGSITISEIDVMLKENQTNAIYTCSATNNQLGITVADTVTVGVLYPPSPPEIYGYTEGSSIRAGQLLRLTCRAEGGNPPATLAWYKGAEMLTGTDRTIGNLPTQEVDIVTSADDNGAIYKCTATNRATDIPLEAVKKLTVHFPPASVNIVSEPVQAREGQSLRLTCTSASSNPAAVITWIHNNKRELGTNMNQTDADNGGKLSKNRLEIVPTAALHNAVYGCRATNLVLQETIHDAITLNVLFKPVFGSPNTFDIMEGHSRDIDLKARANPDNATYTLMRGGVQVNSGDIQSFSLEGSVLMVSGMHRIDAGSYTVMATNTEGSTSHNFTINVQFPAEIYENNAVEGVRGGSVELRCLARANPMVADMITWQREGWDMTRALASYADGTGTLTISELQKTDSGTFTCIADNKLAEPVQQTIELTVKFSPSIDKSQEFRKAASDTGVTGTLRCWAEGAPTVTFQWQKDGIAITPDSVKYEVQQKVAEDNINYENILLVKDVQKVDYGIYLCIVTNEKGEDRFSINFDDTTIPDAPYNLTFVNATHNSITLRWKNNFDGGRDQSYRVRYRPADTTQGYIQVDVQPSDSTIFTVRGLALGTEYELTVMAWNDLGGSEYQLHGLKAKTSNLKPTDDQEATSADTAEDTPVIIILVVCVVGIFLLALNIGLILYFVRRRKKRLENSSDTTSHTNTIELYGPSKETALYPMTPSDESRSYGTYDKNDDDFSEDYKSYEDEDLKRVFLPPPEYGSVTYSHNKMDSPTYDHRHPVHTELKQPYSNGSDTDSCRKSPWMYEDMYKPQRGKGTFDSDYADHHRHGNMYEPNGHAGGVRSFETRPKSVTEMSERSSRPSSRGMGGAAGHKTPPPPPVRSSSKGAVDIPPLPARNYGSQEGLNRYAPWPGPSSSYNNVNVIPNPSYEGPSIHRTPSPRQQVDPEDDMRGHLV